MEAKEARVNGRLYKLKKYGHPEQTAIDDVSWDTVPVPGTEEIKVVRKVGTYYSMVVFYSLVSWEIKDAEGKLIPLDLPNFKIHFPPEDRMPLFQQAAEVNGLGEEVKNALSGKSAKL